MSVFQEKAELALSELHEVFHAMQDEHVRPLLEAIKQANRIFTLGAGREGIATRAFAMRLMHLGKETHWIWDDTCPGVKSGDLLIAVCGAGSIGQIDHVVQMASKRGVKTAVISPSASGKSVELADIHTWVPAQAYKAEGEFVLSRQPMGNLFEQTLFLLYDVLVMVLQEELNIQPEEMSARHRNVE